MLRESYNRPTMIEPGDHVLVPSLGKGIVREVRSGGRYRVEIKGRSFLVDEQQLSPADTRKSSRAARITPAAPTPATPAPRLDVPTSLDLHGMTADEASGALDTFISDAILAGHTQLRVIHGRSGGRLKSVVHAGLKKIGSVAFRLDPHNPGVTIITL